MKADYHIDSEFEEIGQNASFHSAAAKQGPPNPDLLVNPTFSPMSSAYPNQIAFAGGYPPAMFGQMPPMGGYPYPPVHPGYAIGPDG